ISDEVPISVEDGLAQNLKVGPGSKLTLDVQGAQVETVIRAIRRVNWRQIGTTFFMVFPSGVLEEAPQTFALSLSPSNSDVKLDIIRSFGKKFPNISSIDLTSILDAIDRLFQQVVRLMNFMVASIFLLSLLLFFTACYFRHQMRRREHG